jgi:SseB protein N-terminal domain
VKHDRRLAQSAFPGDDGAAAAETRERLAAVTAEGTPIAYLRAVAALCGDRILVPVVATSTRLGQTIGGLASDKEAEMSVVLLQAHSGRRAMLGFTGLDSLKAWQASSARPVPVTLDVAAKTTLAEGGVALVIDIAGPDSLVIDGEVLDQLAAGHRLLEVEPDVFGWAVSTAE